MPIGIGSSQLVMYILRRGEWRKPKEDTDHPQCHSRTEQTQETLGCIGCGIMMSECEHVSDFACGTDSTQKVC